MKTEQNTVEWLSRGLILAVIALIGVVVVREWDQIIAFPWRLDLKYLSLSLLFHSLALGTTFLVWYLMIDRLSGFNDLTLNIRFYYLSTLAKRVPTAVWYVGGRLAMYRQVGVAGSVVIGCILLENIMIAMAGALVFLTLLPMYSHVLYPHLSLKVGGPIALAGISLFSLLLVRPRVLVDFTNRVLRRLGRSELENVPATRDIALWVGLYTLPWLFAGASLYFAILALSDVVGPGIWDSIGISTLAMLVTILSFVLPGGFGLKELTFGALLSFWMPLSSALVLSVAYRLLQTGNEVVWAMVASTLPVLEDFPQEYREEEVDS
jgi:hypothetical protein